MTEKAKDLTEDQINMICREFAFGRTVENISVIEQLPAEKIKQILTDNAEKVRQLRQFFKAMGMEVL